MKVRELGRFIRDQRSSASLSLRKLSGLTGVSIPYLSQIERGLRRPSADILQAIAKALRVSAETLYVKAGILDERGEASDPVGEILRDPAITDRQKRILVDLYLSFREGAGEESAPVAAARTVATARTKAKPKAKPRATAAGKRKAPAAQRTSRAKKAASGKASKS